MFEMLKKIFLMMVGQTKVEIPKIDKSYLGKLPSSSRVKPIKFGIIHCVSAWRVNPDKRNDIDEIVKIFKDYKVSAHALIARDGTIFELVSDDRVAYHAGKSFWRGKSSLNKWSLGVELVGAYNGPYLSEGFTDEQYDSLILWIKDKSDSYNLSVEDWIGHEMVSPGRKQDPGPKFSWYRLRQNFSNKEE